MKIAVLSDIHDNIPRLEEALDICAQEKVRQGVCCGDIQRLETLGVITKSFDKVYLAFGNGDYTIARSSGLIPENVEWDERVLTTDIDGQKVAIVHYDYRARELAKDGQFDVVFYGHTHTPWEKKIGKTLMINPGEIAGQYGQATFAIFDTKTMKAELFLLR